ncbi:hypothetical protein U8Q05_37335 (plasmid) [Rhizobium ruizarguesonis]|nr:hypothetical protein U8Q05_37335 [Rhizobium ruizarguesonis]
MELADPRHHVITAETVSFSCPRRNRFEGLELPRRSHAERAMPAKGLPLSGRDLRRTSPRTPSRGDVM